MNDDLYPSRVGGREQIIPRQDPVVYHRELPHGLDPLDQEDLRHYEENGYLVFPDFLPEMVEPIRTEVEVMRTELAGRQELVREPQSNELRTIFNPCRFSTTVANLFRHPRVLPIVRQLLGSDVYMMQSRVNNKPAFTGKSFAWHSDFETWHVEDGLPRMRALTAWLMLTENHERNGPLYVIPGSHHLYVSCRGRTGADNYRTSLREQKLGVPEPDTMHDILNEREIHAITGAPGTLVIHECNLLHGSPDNISNEPRQVAMCVYNSVHNRPVAPFGGQKPRPDFLSSRDTAPVSVAMDSASPCDWKEAV
ncbi:phytanoyl-CoA dioxygenase family protein [Microbulbifer yueqingensis]|uniref:Ectoine hydroxylase n=1 Tax=Microbulbifer yueqingensis TaxID=658219 RepID=A0A1G9BD62_9GAMM|nr:phytanoyl-CoA dioxygenase family protein [Microbulbifer yueqingensis]SDK37050.1 ectoine hydroxylase [Microbulbifer yueqingensis]